MTTKLFRVTSTVPEFDGYKDVQIEWFVQQRPAPTNRPYRELIKGEPIEDANTQGWIESAIDELFSEDEAAAWAAWLRKNRHGEHAVTEAKLPYLPNTMPISATPFSGDQGCLMIWKSPGYDLPFKVEGYYDLQHYEPVSKVNHPEKSAPDTRP
jgi:hypothetical protein